MPKIKIYSHNVCWPRRRKNSNIINSKILDLSPDIVCLQEWGVESQFKAYKMPGYEKSSIPVLKVGTVGKMASVYLRESSKVGTCGGLVIFSKIKPLKIDFIPLQKQISPFPHYLTYLAEKVAQRGFLVAEFEQFVVINTHLSPDQKKKWSDKNTKLATVQLEQIINYCKTIQDKKILLCGDFNLLPQNPGYIQTINTGFQDLTSNIPFTYIDRKAKLDYIFANFKTFWTDSKLVVFEKAPSDHFGILTEIEY
jgi:endonuclease/exonuclease/phosphatase family metal-dependent hydrolase